MAAIVCARNIRKIIKYPFFDAEIESRYSRICHKNIFFRRI